jgi:N-acetylglucosaminyldiphosphoundecaprenol N-acetyl-beta-D-mannosaminyltransferase
VPGPRTSASDRARVDVLGCAIDRCTLEEAVARCRDAIEAGAYAQQSSVNVAKLVAMRKDPALRAAVQSSTLINADGQPVVWASRLLGDPLPERVAGIDLMERLLGLAEARGYPVFFLGAREDVLRRGLDAVRGRHPRLVIAGARDGYFQEQESGAVRDEIAAAGPKILFVAMSSPRKELWIAEHGPRLGVPVVMGVGGALDVLAGVVSRAPRWAQRAGLEWLVRLLQEPRRLWRRYLVSNARFLALLGPEIVRRRSARLLRSASESPDRR